jgi:trehalose 6-phosphate synthase
LICAGRFIVGIDPQKFSDTLQKQEVLDRIQTLEERYKGMKIIVGVDRLDYIKGLAQKLKGFDSLENHPELRNKVVLIQVAVPSREDVKEYQDLETELSTLAGKINGKHGRVNLPKSQRTRTDTMQPPPREHRCCTCIDQCRSQS